MIILHILMGLSKIKTKDDWEVIAKGILKSELARLDVNYITLSAKLRSFGIEETPENLSNKIARGKFSTVFLIQCLYAIDCHEIYLKNGR